ncbi:helix-turn-helix domain-containing protein [Pararcticibacter amylolyticus]|uniref:AraC family transcriptional regulator n=1 Tax=Pararcticibacter amylolyticus TaxID=2173175 RepID=A0A2U2PAC8_9SPHI|nr:AraC family transcriptional regulator [Pararcticibacter amylolyticus]PWG78332.1 AraC family transcriptional regulator [Pararcticibacter amylolyticus]
MIRENLFEPYSITYKTIDECPKEAHQHTFFELVYIVSGTGLQCINKNQFNYHEGHMFLITPDDCHSFEVQTTTTFFFLRFSNFYLKSGGLPQENIRRLEFILQNANHRPGCILRNQTDKLLAAPVIEAIIREHSGNDIYSQELIKQLVNTLIIIVARNISKYQQVEISEYTEEKALDILHYLQANIYQPAKLRTKQLCKHFNMSTAYLGTYFKTHTGSTIRQYVSDYKLKLICHRLEFSDKRIREIAGEFNFTDESHFNRFFRKQAGRSPKEYRGMRRTNGF